MFGLRRAAEAVASFYERALLTEDSKQEKLIKDMGELMSLVPRGQHLRQLSDKWYWYKHREQRGDAFTDEEEKNMDFLNSMNMKYNLRDYK